MYAILNAAFVPIIYYFIVETAGKSLEQIDQWFAVNKGWFVHRVGDVEYRETMTMKEGKRDLGDEEEEEEEERERLVSGNGEGKGGMYDRGGGDGHHRAVSTEDYDDFVYDDDDLHSIGPSESSEEEYGLHKDGVKGD